MILLLALLIAFFIAFIAWANFITKSVELLVDEVTRLQAEIKSLKERS